MKKFNIEFFLDTGDTVTNLEIFESIKAYLETRPIPYGRPRALRVTPIEVKPPSPRLTVCRPC